MQFRPSTSSSLRLGVLCSSSFVCCLAPMAPLLRRFGFGVVRFGVGAAGRRPCICCPARNFVLVPLRRPVCLTLHSHSFLPRCSRFPDTSRTCSLASRSIYLVSARRGGVAQASGWRKGAARDRPPFRPLSPTPRDSLAHQPNHYHCLLVTVLVAVFFVSRLRACSSISSKLANTHPVLLSRCCCFSATLSHDPTPSVCVCVRFLLICRPRPTSELADEPQVRCVASVLPLRMCRARL